MTMRAACWVVMLVGIAIGCGKKADPTTSGRGEQVPAPKPVTLSPQFAPATAASKEAPPSSTEKKPDVKPKDNGPPIVIDVLKFINEYKDHQLAADAKYRGRQIEVKVGVRKTGRTKSGEPYIGSIYGSEREDPPVILYVFPKEREADVAALKAGEVVTVVGTCTGRVDDGQPRMVKGMEFYINVENCSIKK